MLFRRRNQSNRCQCSDVTRRAVIRALKSWFRKSLPKNDRMRSLAARPVISGARSQHYLRHESLRRLVIITVTMPILPLILISVFITVVVVMMLFPLRFPLSVFEFFVRPYSASRRPSHRLQIRHVLGRQPKRIERPHVEFAGRRNSQAILERAHRECCAAPVSAVNPASIISATPQLTLHFCAHPHMQLSRR